MTSEWYVSFHGGDEKETLNNIHVYSNDGRELRKALNTKSLAVGVTLRELRGFVFGPDQNLYVVNSHYEYSEVLKFKGALNNDGQHDFVGIFVKRDSVSNPGISHPFNAVFDSEGDLYVSSQDTSLVSRYYGPTSKVGNPGTPIASATFPQRVQRNTAGDLYSVEEALVSGPSSSQGSHFCIGWRSLCR